jgi:hypothetical protein
MKRLPSGRNGGSLQADKQHLVGQLLLRRQVGASTQAARSSASRVHHGRVLRRVQIGRRGVARGSHTPGTIGRVKVGKRDHCIAHLGPEARRLWEQLRKEWLKTC